MPFLKLFLGKQGVAGKNGADGLGSGNINGLSLQNPLLEVLNKKNEAEVVSGGLSINRSTGAYIEDDYGELVHKQSAESTNLVDWSNDFSQWTLTQLLGINSTGNLDPFGENTGTEFIALADGSKGVQIPITLSQDEYYTISFYVKVTFGTLDSLEVYTNAGFREDIDGEPSGEYQRFTRTFNHANFPTTLIGIQPNCLTGTRFIIYGVQVESQASATEYKATFGSPVTAGNFGILRQNRLGYFIEGEKFNHATSSEDLSANTWSTSGGTISKYAFSDPFGQSNKWVNVKSLNSESITLTNASSIGYVIGKEYTVSFYGLAISGSITSIVAGVGGGDQLPFDQLSTTGIERRSVKVIAGDESNDLVITITSENSTADALLTGFQVEEGNITSYIKAANNNGFRDAEDISFDTYNNSIITEFSLSLIINQIDKSQGILYLFNNGLTGAFEFSAWIDQDEIKVKTGIEITTADWGSKTRLGISYINKELSIYGDGGLISSKTLNDDIQESSSTFTLFDSQAKDSAMYGYLYGFKWYNRKLSEDEFKFIHGSNA